MSATYPLSLHRRIERQWAERVNSQRQNYGQIVVGTERTVQRVFNNDDSLVAPGKSDRGSAITRSISTT
jgi:hypothetical protein